MLAISRSVPSSPGERSPSDKFSPGAAGPGGGAVPGPSSETSQPPAEVRGTAPVRAPLYDPIAGLQSRFFALSVSIRADLALKVLKVRQEIFAVNDFFLYLLKVKLELLLVGSPKYTNQILHHHFE